MSQVSDIAKLILCQIVISEKPRVMVAAKYSSLTVDGTLIITPSIQVPVIGWTSALPVVVGPVLLVLVGPGLLVQVGQGLTSIGWTSDYWYISQYQSVMAQYDLLCPKTGVSFR